MITVHRKLVDYINIITALSYCDIRPTATMMGIHHEKLLKKNATLYTMSLKCGKIKRSKTARNSE